MLAPWACGIQSQWVEEADTWPRRHQVAAWMMWLIWPSIAPGVVHMSTPCPSILNSKTLPIGWHSAHLNWYTLSNQSPIVVSRWHMRQLKTLSYDAHSQLIFLSYQQQKLWTRNTWRSNSSFPPRATDNSHCSPSATVRGLNKFPERPHQGRDAQEQVTDLFFLRDVNNGSWPLLSGNER